MELARELGFDSEAGGLELDLRKKLIKLSQAFRKKGFKVSPFREDSWKVFRSFPLERKNQIFADFSLYFDIYMSVLDHPVPPNEDGRLLWAAVKRLGLRPCSDLFSQIGETDIVEFYGPTGLQIFHNINFFDVCSYTFLDIFLHPFTELWIRDPVAFEDAKQVAVDGFMGKFKSTVDAYIPRQFLLESFSEARYIIQLDFTKFSPLYSADGAIAALAVVSKGKVIDRAAYSKILRQMPSLPRPIP